MPQFLEFEGKSVDKALEAAANQLNTTIDALDYDVVSYGSSGIFGLVGVKKAKIRVRSDNGHGNSTIESEARSRARDIVKDAFGESTKSVKKFSKSAKPAKPAKQVKPAKPAKQAAPVKPKETAPAPAPASAPAPAPDLDQATIIGKEALERMIRYITEDATIEADPQNNRIVFNIQGGQSALLIGKRGQTLEALQYLVEKIVNAQCDGHTRILVDVEGYLSTRKSNLQRMATKMADKAKRINKPVTIGQMNAHDRRIVHMHLKENQAVRTQSVGEGYYRKLVIFPKRRRRSKGPKKEK